MELTINERIKKIIEELGITANVFAQELDVAGSVVYNIIKGRNKPSFDILDKIVSSFNVNPNYLLTGKGDFFSSKNESVKMEVQRTGDSDEDYIRFIKQWERVRNIVEKLDEPEVSKYYSGFSAVISKMSTIIEHYSLINQSIAFFRFAPKKISNELLTSQIVKMLEYQDEIARIIVPYKKNIAAMYKKIEEFNENHDNILHVDNDTFDSFFNEEE